jgi:hypothetical protein
MPIRSFARSELYITEEALTQRKRKGYRLAITIADKPFFLHYRVSKQAFSVIFTNGNYAFSLSDICI